MIASSIAASPSASMALPCALPPQRHHSPPRTHRNLREPNAQPRNSQQHNPSNSDKSPPSTSSAPSEISRETPHRHNSLQFPVPHRQGRRTGDRGAPRTHCKHRAPLRRTGSPISQASARNPVPPQITGLAAHRPAVLSAGHARHWRTTGQRQRAHGQTPLALRAHCVSPRPLCPSLIVMFDYH